MQHQQTDADLSTTPNSKVADSEEAAEVGTVDSEAMIDVAVIDAAATGNLRLKSRSKRGSTRNSMATGRKVASRNMVSI